MAQTPNDHIFIFHLSLMPSGKDMCVYMGVHVHIHTQGHMHTHVHAHTLMHKGSDIKDKVDVGVYSARALSHHGSL